MTRLPVRPTAAADIEEAYRWYEPQRVGLGEELLGPSMRPYETSLHTPPPMR